MRPLLLPTAGLALLCAMGGVDRWTQQRLDRALSGLTGRPTRVGAVSVSFTPSLVLDQVQVGSDLFVQRIEIVLGWGRGWRPRVKQVVLWSPRLRWTARGTVGTVLTDEPADSSRPGRSGTTTRPPGSQAGTRKSRPSRPSARKQTSLRKLPPITVRNGRVVGTVQWASRRLHFVSQNVFVTPGLPAYRVVSGRTAIVSPDKRFQARLSAISLDIHSDDPRTLRAAALDGKLVLPWARFAAIDIQLLQVHSDYDAVGVRLVADASSRPPRTSGRLRLTGKYNWTSLRGSGSLLVQRLPLVRYLPPLDKLSLNRATADGELTIRSAPTGVDVSGQLELSDVVLRHPQLARRNIGPTTMAVAINGSYQTSTRTAHVTKLELRTGRLQLVASGSAGLADTQPHLSMSLAMQPTPCQDILASMPPGLVPKLKGMLLKGDLGLRAQAEVEGDLDAAVVDVNLTPLGCQVLQDAANADVKALNQTLSLTRTDAKGRPLTWVVGPANPFYLPLHRISPLIRAAFVVAEDSRFFSHSGFDARQIRRALLFNIDAGRIARGASTISQQLVKNVFFGHQRTVSRKLQEAVITWRMEQLISKRRILELYLNLVELGPGIYGVEQAAQRYFGCSASNVNPLQAVHLAALTPSPRLFARRLSRGNPSPSWKARLRTLLRSMRQQGHIDRETEQRWAASELKLQRGL